MSEHRIEARPGGQSNAEAAYRALVERLPAIVYREAATGDVMTIEYISPRVEEMLGIPPDEWTTNPRLWEQVIHPDDRDRVLALDRRVQETGEQFLAEYRAIARDGRVVWFRDEATLVRDEEGRPLHWQGMMLDITERRQAEEQLREAEERYRTLVEQTPVVTYLDAIAPSDRTLYMSPQAEALLGYTPEEMTREEPLWPELLHPDDRERVLGESRRSDTTGEPYDTEYRLVARDGRAVWIHDRSSLIRDEDGNPVVWLGVLIDITERRRAEELERALEVEREAAAELRALDEMKNTFLQAVSHDLRTPLAAILGLAVTLEREDLHLEAAESRDLAGRIVANARRLDRLVNDLLDLDRLSRGIVVPRLEPTDVGAFVRALVRESDLLTGRNLVIEAEPVVAAVDPGKLERIVENLLANTARHTPPGTNVWVRVQPRERGVLIAVDDDGPGIAPEHRQEIFEPFRRGPGAPDRAPSTGVGLALVARFAELHGGRAWVEGREEGGASFRVYLPDAPPEAD